MTRTPVLIFLALISSFQTGRTTAKQVTSDQSLSDSEIEIPVPATLTVTSNSSTASGNQSVSVSISPNGTRILRQISESDNIDVEGPYGYIPRVVHGVNKIVKGLLQGNVHEVFHGAFGIAPEDSADELVGTYNRIFGIPDPEESDADATTKKPLKRRTTPKSKNGTASATGGKGKNATAEADGGALGQVESALGVPAGSISKVAGVVAVGAGAKPRIQYKGSKKRPSESELEAEANAKGDDEDEEANEEDDEDDDEED